MTGSISLDGINGPLQYFRVWLDHDDDMFVFEHRLTGNEIRIASAPVLAEYVARRQPAWDADEFPNLPVRPMIGPPLIELFEQFVGPLCHGCGCQFDEPRGLCEDCRCRQIEDLRNMVDLDR